MSDSNAITVVSASKLRGVVRGIKFILISYVISVILIAIVAALLTFTELPEAAASPAVSGITLFGAFLSAFLTTRTLCTKGWLWGMITGICNVLILSLAGRVIYSSVNSSGMLLMLLGAGVCGALGGIIGINSKR